jgi:hypothetical protein
MMRLNYSSVLFEVMTEDLGFYYKRRRPPSKQFKAWLIETPISASPRETRAEYFKYLIYS